MVPRVNEGPLLRHLGVEATRLLQEKRGIGRYVRNLLRDFAEQHPTLRFTLYVAHADDEQPLRALLSSLSASLVSRCRIERVDRLPASEADVVWYPWNFVTTAARSATMVVTIHDLAPMLRHDHRWWKVMKRFKYRRRYERTLRHAHAIVTDAECIRQEIISRLGADMHRITAVPLAADDLPLDTPPAIAVAPAVPAGPFFLCVGGQDARKNLPALYRAMALLHARGVAVPLVQCGPAPSRETRAVLARSPWLRHVGYVSDEQLVALYRRATALVFPSRYEGFGLPVLEAMRLGTPVICGISSSLPEVAGDAAEYCDVTEAASLADAMERLLNESARAALLRERGQQRAAQFSWATTARLTFEAFERAAAFHRATPAASAHHGGSGGVPIPVWQRPSLTAP